MSIHAKHRYCKIPARRISKNKVLVGQISYRVHRGMSNIDLWFYEENSQNQIIYNITNKSHIRAILDLTPATPPGFQTFAFQKCKHCATKSDSDFHHIIFVFEAVYFTYLDTPLDYMFVLPSTLLYTSVLPRDRNEFSPASLLLHKFLYMNSTVTMVQHLDMEEVTWKK